MPKAGTGLALGMCGIFGSYYFDRGGRIDPALFVRQVDAIAHRGPDDGGAYIESGVGIGHRRLSIIDLDGGHQPMWDVEQRMGIVYNGEIYNFRELRRILRRKGHRFQSDSDTEVILHAYREWGRDCVDHFVGMFAFCIFDRKERTLFLARDRLGKKPLYYYEDRERFVFGSELKSLLIDQSLPRVIDPEAVKDFFAYNYIPGPKTIFAGFRKLPAGTSLYVTSRGMTLHRYWRPVFGPFNDFGVDKNAESLTEILVDSVKLRLRSDVPLGAFLSGGVDSSLIVSLMASAVSSPVKTQTIGFKEQEYDERAYARETAELYKTEHREQVVQVDALDVIDELSWFYDEPFGDSSAVPTYYLSQATRDFVTVALSGDGGDENFAGYRRYVFAMYEAMIRERIPNLLRTSLISPAARLYPKADYLPQFLRAKSTLTNLSVPHERAYFLSLTQKSYPQFLDRDFLLGLQNYDPFAHFEEHLKDAECLDPLSRIQYVDLKMYLCDDILVKVDRASMAHSLEVRVPLLDHRLVDFAGAIPPGQKLFGKDTKIVLKRAAEKNLPRQILDRKKKGFTVPLPEWFRGGLRARAEDTFFGKPGGASGLLNATGLRRMWYEHQLKIRNHATSLWSILMFETWANRFMNGNMSAPALKREIKPTRVQPSIE